MSIVFGVDPGASGAIAVVTATGRLVEVLDMPHHDGTVSAALVADFVDAHNEPDAEAWVEAVQGWKGQAAGASFKFGAAFGTVLGVLGALRIPVHLITPARWKRAAGLNADKGACRRRAIETWPEASHLFARVKDDGRAEAALLAQLGAKA